MLLLVNVLTLPMEKLADLVVQDSSPLHVKQKPFMNFYICKTMFH